MSINGKQLVKLEKRIIEFKNHFKQIPVSFKICANFECNLRVLNVMKVVKQKNIKIIFLVALIITFFVLIIDLLTQLLFIEVKMQLMNLLKPFLKSINIAEKY